jgi:hypothetical protein
VAGSTCESKFIALSEFLNILSDLGIVHHKNIVYEDNRATIILTTSLSISGNSHGFGRSTTNEIMDIIYVPTNQKLADTF